VYTDLEEKKDTTVLGFILFLLALLDTFRNSSFQQVKWENISVFRFAYRFALSVFHIHIECIEDHAPPYGVSILHQAHGNHMH
jgi:hypothetical protein